MRTKFQRERLRIEGEKPNFKLLEFSNSWIGIVAHNDDVLSELRTSGFNTTFRARLR